MADRADIRELKKDEALPRAILNVDRNTTREQKEALTQIRAQHTKDNPRSLTEKLATPLTEIPSIDILKHTIDSFIDVENKASGTRGRTTEQQGRVFEATQAAELAHRVLEKGFKNAAPADKQRVRENVLPAMKRLWPEISLAFGTMTLTEQEAAMDELLSDPRFARELTSILNGLVGQAENPKKVEDQAYQDAKNAYDEVDLNFRRLTTEHTQAADLRRQFELGGSRLAELTALGDQATLQTALVRDSEQYKKLDKEKARITEDIASLRKNEGNPRFSDAERANFKLERESKERRLVTIEDDELPQLETKIRTSQHGLSLIDKFEKDKEEAIKEEKRLALEKDKLALERRKLETKMFIEQANLNLAQGARDAHEKAQVNQFKESFAKAAEEVLRERVAEYEASRDKMIESATEKALADGSRKRWVDRDGKIRKDAVKADYNRLIQGNMKDVVADMLAVEGGMRSRDEALHKLNTDKEFSTQATSDATERLLTRHLQSGGKMTEDEARRLADSELGIAVINKAMTKREEFKNHLKDLKEKGIVPADWDWNKVLKNLPNPTVKQLLGMAVGAGAFFFGAPYVLSFLTPQIINSASRWGGVMAGNAPQITTP